MTVFVWSKPMGYYHTVGLIGSNNDSIYVKEWCAPRISVHRVAVVNQWGHVGQVNLARGCCCTWHWGTACCVRAICICPTLHLSIHNFPRISAEIWFKRLSSLSAALAHNPPQCKVRCKWFIDTEKSRQWLALSSHVKAFLSSISWQLTHFKCFLKSWLPNPWPFRGNYTTGSRPENR